ncbi:hypothetical protein LTR78_003867 [Recurvomyces mirabilis]|uniref:P-loop containing nucleoside triphosphate hydrolase protein n=1 Tax=Recurvomyces mirabilis TaxID=574656 RepID=A0AAE0WQS0_9PEZI|nr:hypothetical protein LTR78_003867 [Recurvomyces mirabilis]KAK5153994.1 hypothetical protein LTS14_007214 [Recurvomyces mirabilis]
MATEADFKRIGNYARMYNKDQNIDRRHAKRKVPLEVICPGYSRTGTLTMQKAMTILGYPNPYHFSSFYDNIRDSDMWMEALDAKFNGKGELPDRAFFDGILSHVGATTDAPCNLFTEELVESYPEAKVVLVERDIDAWYNSWVAFCESAYSPTIAAIARYDPYWMGKIAGLGGAITRPQAGFALTFNQARARSRNAYRHHYRDVRDCVPREMLLEFKLEDGWEPLCAFLGKAVPGVPFPHENETKANKRSFVELGQLGMKRIASRLALIVLAIGLPITAAWFLRS